jgi:hypothetical protein
MTHAAYDAVYESPDVPKRGPCRINCVCINLHSRASEKAVGVELEQVRPFVVQKYSELVDDLGYGGIGSIVLHRQLE